MNKAERKKVSEQNRKLYKIPSGANYQLRSKNAIYISPTNSLRHELAKTIGAYMLRKYGDIKFSEQIGKCLYCFSKIVTESMKDFPKEKHQFTFQKRYFEKWVYDCNRR